MPCGSIGKLGVVRADKLFISEINVPNTDSNNPGTLKLLDNLSIGADGLILQDLNEFTSSDNGTQIIYADDSTATATVTVPANKTGTDILTSSVSKTNTEVEIISVNSKTYKTTQSGTTITIDKTSTKKIVSLEDGNLVLATYDEESGERSNKEVIFDSNNSIGEINGANHNLMVKSLDVTKTDSIVEADELTDGQVRIDDTLFLGGIITSKTSSNGTIVIDPDGTGSLTLGSSDNTAVTIDAKSFSIDAAGVASNITLTSNSDDDDLTISLAGSTNSSLNLLSSGTGPDAINIITGPTGGGGIDIDSAGPLSITSTDVLNITTSALNKKIKIDPHGNGTIELGSADNTKITLEALEISTSCMFLLLYCDNSLQINSSGGTINIGNDDINQNINIGTGGIRSVTIGNANNSSSNILLGNRYNSLINKSDGLIGDGFDSVTKRDVYINTIGEAIITTILIDFGSNNMTCYSTGDARIIGKDGIMLQSHFYKVTSAVNGVVYKVELNCIETPTIGDTNIGITQHSNIIFSGDPSSVAGEAIITGVDVIEKGVHVSSIGTIPDGLNNKYLYLFHVGTPSSNVLYGAGKFLIKLYGSNT